MERFGFKEARMSMLLIRRIPKQVERSMSKLAAKNQTADKQKEAPKQVERCMSELAQKIPTSEKHKEHYSTKGGHTGGPSRWVPHPRTGIYYPTGHERVMDDVPDGAASFVESHWLRNTDGVDQKPEADVLFPCNPVTLTKT
ncbi:uncharacterized protein LOC131326283 isoform X2 [Rhododendron vialii]|uniref:uncharacterized protein LOC131326283 isoform X2 n=1 Tax=Rhododendron vialii TaxID=182163 RepID=UPI00265F0E20|nr:uncharacterized protein LOC131326283 isoform X2 [Rhododendron vialii]